MDNSVVYISQVDAKANGLPFASMFNRAGSKVTASVTTVQSAMEDFRSDVGAGERRNFLSYLRFVLFIYLFIYFICTFLLLLLLYCRFSASRALSALPQFNSRRTSSMETVLHRGQCVTLASSSSGKTSPPSTVHTHKSCSPSSAGHR